MLELELELEPELEPELELELELELDVMDIEVSPPHHISSYHPEGGHMVFGCTLSLINIMGLTPCGL